MKGLPRLSQSGSRVVSQGIKRTEPGINYLIYNFVSLFFFFFLSPYPLQGKIFKKNYCLSICIEATFFSKVIYRFFFNLMRSLNLFNLV